MNSAFLRASEAALARFGVPALQLATLRDGRTESLALGCTPDDRFRIASITKPLTASLVLETLELDAVTGVWPDDVRVRHLLSHTSGFDCELGDLARFGDGDDALASLTAELPATRRFLGVDEVWSYANTGYWLAGSLAARAAECTYEDALFERVLRPAGLDRTDFGEASVPGSGAGASDAPYPRARRSSGGLVSTASDLLRFAAWHLATPASARLRVPHGTTLRGVYGLGLFGERVDEVEVWGHGGSYGGFQSSLLLVPDRGAAFVGLTNAALGGRALDEIEDMWLEEVVGARRAVAEAVAIEPHRLERFAGTYANSSLRIDVRTDGAGLGVTIHDPDGGERTLAARAIGPDRFEVVGGDEHGDRFDFPRAGFVRFGGRLAARTPCQTR